MNHHLAYAAEKFGSAVYDMARSDAPIRQRVLDAFEKFNPVGFFLADLPPKVVAGYRELHTRLTCLGETERALRSFSDQEVRRLASLIVDTEIDVDDAFQDDLRRTR